MLNNKKPDMSFDIRNPSQGQESKRDPKSSTDSKSQSEKNSKKSKPEEKRARSTFEDDEEVYDRPKPPKPKRRLRSKNAEDAPTSVATVKPKRPRASITTASVTNVVSTGAGTRRSSRLSKGARSSIVGEDAEALQQLLEDGDSDSAITMLNKRLIQTCIDLISEVEAGIRESQGRYGVHSFNGLIQSIRELMIDLQATQDRGAIGVNLVESVIRPAMQEIAMSIMKEYQLLYDDLKSIGISQEQLVSFKKVQIDSRTRIGSSVQDTYERMKQEAIQFLQR